MKDIIVSIFCFLGVLIGCIYIYKGSKRRIPGGRFSFSEFAWRTKRFNTSTGQQLIGEGIIVIATAIALWLMYYKWIVLQR